MHSRSDLIARLEQYESTAGGETNRRLSTAEIAGFAAAAGAGLAMAGAADAAIIYSGVQNISVAINPAAQATNLATFTSQAHTAIDIDGGGADMNLNLLFYGALRGAGTATAKYGGRGEMVIDGGAAFMGAGSVFSTLPSSAMIGPAGTFAAIGGGRFRQNYISGGYSAYNYSGGNISFNTTGVVGIRLGSNNYGWIRLRIDDLGDNQPYSDLLNGSPVGNGENFPDRVTVIDWAYEDSGAAIHARDTGATPAPAPSPLALLAAGAVGIGAFRRRMARAR